MTIQRPSVARSVAFRRSVLSFLARRHRLAGRTCGRPAQLDDPPPSRRDRSARGRAHQPFATVQGLAKKSSAGGRPRHTLKGRQTESDVEGLRLQLRKQ
jgi:hypothetical protein